MFEFKNKVILIISPEDFGENLLSKHLYAIELSKNNKVFFLHSSPHPNQKQFIDSIKINSNLSVIHIQKVVKGIFKLSSFIIDLQNHFIINKIKKFIGQPIDIVWSFDQSKFQNLNQFNTAFSIFHPVDYIEKAQPFLTKIANSADVVLSVSELILKQIITSTPKHFINHGLDNTFIQNSEPKKIPEFIDSSKTTVGYVGNLQIKSMDWESLTKTIELNPIVNFVFIGPSENSNIGGNKKHRELEVIKKFQNVKFIGPLSKIELQQVLCFFDCFIICYDHKKYPIQVSNSHKILELLSSGKVIVSSYTDTYKDTTLFEMVSNNSKLPETLSNIVQNLNAFNSQEKQNERKEFAYNNTYAKQIIKIENIINQKR